MIFFGNITNLTYNVSLIFNIKYFIHILSKKIILKIIFYIYLILNYMFLE
jgi:hypothetical protein